MEFKRIMAKYEELYHRVNDTVEKVFEFEFYSILNDLVSVLHAFETNARKVLVAGDQYELLSQLERTRGLLEGNIKHLEESQESGEE
jgi:hypothetical protein